MRPLLGGRHEGLFQGRTTGSVKCLVFLLCTAVGAVESAQYQLSDQRSGMNCVNYDAASKLAWHKPGGDWQDADGVSHGGQPFSLRTIALARERQHIEWNVTKLAQEWEVGAGPSGGIFLRRLASKGGAVAFHSREAKEPAARPRLVIDWSDGTRTELLPFADATMTCTSFGALVLVAV